MNKIYNFYIDESCYLENDHFPTMGIGYCKVLFTEYESLKLNFKKIKIKWRNPTEIKWNNLSNSRLGLYKELIDFFYESQIDFRCIVIKNKDLLKNNEYNNNDHKEFYFKCIYSLLNTTLNPPNNEYKVFLDINESKDKIRLNKLDEILNNRYFGNSPFIHFQSIHSHESDFLQLTDLLLGAVSFKIRGEHKKIGASEVKINVLNYLEEKIGLDVEFGTSRNNSKFNIFNFKLK